MTLRVINLFAGPGAGKSTLAAGLFFLMKREYMSVELVTEYAKDLTWQERFNTLEDQLYVFAKQHHRIRNLKGKVDLVVVDSPILQGAIFKRPDYLPANLESLIIEAHDQYLNTNFFIDRAGRKYVEAGRNQTREQAIELDSKILKYMNYLGVEFTTVPSEESSIETMLKIVKERHNGP